MIIKATSHRAVDHLRRGDNPVEPYYHAPTLFTAKGKNFYYLVNVERLDQVTFCGRPIKGITKPKDQNMENYRHCW